jgi:fructose-1,6-bisphosphatase/inositol monophosphatase family enzyme
MSRPPVPTTHAELAELEASVLPVIQRLHRRIRREVLDACRKLAAEELSSVAGDAGGDTLYALDRVSEALLFEELGADAARLGGFVLIAEGLEHGSVVLPDGMRREDARYVVIVDPIDGTRPIMYQKRSAWALTGVALKHTGEPRLSDIALAVQTELPLVKQHLSDELWALRGHGAHAERVELFGEGRTQLPLRPSRSPTLEHGFAMLSRFFPGARDELAAIDEEVVRAVLGPPPAGRALCFEDQYASTGGQLYELMVGHDRFNADLRPLLFDLLARRGEPPGLACHPYDVCAALIATEAGVLVTDPRGAPLDAPLDLESPVAWVGYANAALRASIEPALRAALSRRGLS